MIVFAVIGLLAFWLFCWELGYAIGMYFDATTKWDLVMKPAPSELEVLIGHMDVILRRRAA